MKFLYCPKCKELRVKPWYSIRNRCQICFGDATVIKVPPNWMTYVTYVLYVVVPALVAVYVYGHRKDFIYYAVVGLVALMVVAYADIVRGEEYARSKIKVSGSDAARFRKRGWT